MSKRPRTGDPLLDEIDEARRRILAECDNDPRKALESYLEYQKQFADRLVNYSGQSRRDQSAA
jgi:Mg/Co/Ni transporter MgtE